jgi:hypothetical protein
MWQSWDARTQKPQLIFILRPLCEKAVRLLPE